MKRSNEEALCPSKEEEREIPALVPELWEEIILQNPHRRVVGAVFVLNKCINAYLFERSQLVKTYSMLFKLNKLHSLTGWFMCDGCDKVKIGEICLNDKSVQGSFCDRCMRRCEGCKEYYLRGWRFFHKKCAGFPAPFTPHASDDDELVFEFDMGREEEYYEDNEVEEG